MAVMSVDPGPTMVTVVPETTATAVLELVYETGNSDVAVAVNPNGGWSSKTGASSEKLMTCGALAITRDAELLPT
jgi:hypothetical protein